jgi:pimeloyl-ACP methyl ester carboxylesterase
LRSLLQAAGEKPPYVLVGHSSGVNWVRLYAHTYPNEVAALVLIEPPILEAVPGTMIALLKAARLGIGALSRVGIVRMLGRLGWMGVLTAGSPPPAPLQAAAGWLYNDHSIQGALSEIDALPAAISEMNQRAQPGALGHIPVRVVVAEPTVNAKAGLMAGWQRILALSDRAELVMGHGSHFLHYDQPELIVECIEGAVESSRR